MTNSKRLPELLGGDAARARQELQDLDDALLVLRLSAGRLQAALERCFAPLASLILPPVNRAIQTLTGWLNDAAAVLAELFGFVRRSADKTVRYSGAALKRTLAGFDQIQRLSGSGGGSSTVTIPGEILELPERLRPVVDKILALLEPLKKLDFSAAVAAFERLKQAVEPLGRSLFAALEWVWFNVLVPMAQWGVEQALPAFLEALAAAFAVVGSALQTARPLLSWLWDELLLPMGQWTGEKLLSALGWLSEKLTALSNWLSGGVDTVERFTGKLQALKDGITGVRGEMGLWNTVGGLLSGGISRLSELAGGLYRAFVNVSGVVKEVRDRLVTILQGLPNGFRTLANGLIGVLNTAISAVESGVNSMVRTLTAFKVSVPAWVPGVGGKTFSISAKTMDLPSIPYLARGAVLPANKPFLAMVGDQRHGTNIEAPLTTIQEALRMELADMVGGMMAGFEATLGVQEQILAAVLNIEVGDTTIGEAAARYQTAQNILRGGVV